MKLQIILKQGFDDLKFGCTPENIRLLLGDPEEVEELESPCDGSLESIVWYYPAAGLNFFFDAGNGEPTLSTIESDNPNAVLFNLKLMECTQQQIINVMKDNGFAEYEEEDETWGDHRVTFDDAQIDFYFSDNELVLISWSCY